MAPVLHEAFINRWKPSQAAERANYALFLSELCDVLGVVRPDPTTKNSEKDAYVFEREVVFRHADGTASRGWIDLYKRGAFVLEAKQSSKRQEVASGLLDGLEPAPKRAKGTAVRNTPGGTMQCYAHADRLKATPRRCLRVGHPFCW